VLGKERTVARSSTVAELLRHHRRSAGLSQQELADRCGLSIDAIGMLERGLRTRPRIETVRWIAQGLNLSAEDTRALIVARERPWKLSVIKSGRGYGLRTHEGPVFGRSREVKWMCAKLRQPHPRLLTVTGPPGVGKTRIGLAVIEAMRREVQFTAAVDLARIEDPGVLDSVIAAAIGASDGNRSGLDGLITYIGRDHGVLLLDNFEHLLSAAPMIGDLVERCPELRLVVTSRSPLDLRYENELQVTPLALRPAMTLFTHRVRERLPDFSIDSSSRSAVKRICETMDCLPLAIELAAPWLKTMGAEALADRLQFSLDVLVGGPIDAPERHRTMRGALDWSYRLLDDQQQRLFRWLSVFSGGADLPAIEAVASRLGSGIPVHVLARLIDSSLLVRVKAEGEVRVRALRVIREYGHELLSAAGEVESARRAHFDHYAQIAAIAEPQLSGPTRSIWEARLERDFDNFRSALQWALDRGEAQLGLELAGCLYRFWQRNGHIREGHDWLNRFLALDADVEPPILARALEAASALGWRVGDDPAAIRHDEAGMAMHQDLEDHDGIDSHAVQPRRIRVAPRGSATGAGTVRG
jgi:predicted ATPase/transcriptional regulator with XRE-family HTH domain